MCINNFVDVKFDWTTTITKTCKVVKIHNKQKKLNK